VVAGYRTELSRSSYHISAMWSTQNHPFRRREDVRWVPHIFQREEVRWVPHIFLSFLYLSHKKIFLLRFHELGFGFMFVYVIVMLLYKDTWIRMLGYIKWYIVNNLKIMHVIMHYFAYTQVSIVTSLFNPEKNSLENSFEKFFRKKNISVNISSSMKCKNIYDQLNA